MWSFSTDFPPFFGTFPAFFFFFRCNATSAPSISRFRPFQRNRRANLAFLWVKRVLENACVFPSSFCDTTSKAYLAETFPGSFGRATAQGRGKVSKNRPVHGVFAQVPSCGRGGSLSVERSMPRSSAVLRLPFSGTREIKCHFCRENLSARTSSVLDVVHGFSMPAAPTVSACQTERTR